MTTTQAKRLVIVGLLVTGGLAAVRDLSKGDAPDLRIGLGVVIGGVILSTVAEVAPDVAGMVAVLTMVSATFVVGGDAWSALSKIVK